jgi:hypothetical protein
MDHLLMDIHVMNNLDQQSQSHIYNLHFFRCPRHYHKQHLSLKYQYNQHSLCLRLEQQIENLRCYHQHCVNNHLQVVFEFGIHHVHYSHLGKLNAGMLRLHTLLHKNTYLIYGHTHLCLHILHGYHQKRGHYLLLETLPMLLLLGMCAMSNLHQSMLVLVLIHHPNG